MVQVVLDKVVVVVGSFLVVDGRHTRLEEKIFKKII